MVASPFGHERFIASLGKYACTYTSGASVAILERGDSLTNSGFQNDNDMMAWDSSRHVDKKGGRLPSD